MRKNICKDIIEFLKTNFNGQSNQLENITKIQKLALFVDDYLEVEELDQLLDEIMKNQDAINSFNSLVEAISIKNDKKIVTKVNSVLNNYTVLTLINMFCEITGKEISINITPDYSTIEVSDSVSMYLKEISQYPLLNRREEIVLAQNYAMGDEKAKRDLINCNLRLVVPMAKSYLSSGVPFEDLIQDGNMGLIKAVDKFDCNKGYKFSTYATWWIKQSIRRAIANNSKIIRIPASQQEAYRLYLEAIENLSLSLNHYPSDEELAKYLNISLNKLRKIKACPVNVLSLNENITDDQGDEKMEFIKSDENLETDFSNSQMYASLLDILEDINVSDNAKYVFRRRFIDDSPGTLTEIGNELNITHERVRQLEGKVLRKMKIILEAQENYPKNWRKILEKKKVLKKPLIKQEPEIVFIPVKKQTPKFNEMQLRLIQLSLQYFKIYSETEISTSLCEMTPIEQKVLFNVLLIKNNLADSNLNINTEVILNRFEYILIKKFNLSEECLKTRKRDVLISILKNLYKSLEIEKANIVSINNLKGCINYGK